MNVSATTGNTYNSSASANKGFSGLASGLDTDSMVEALLSGTQSKIDKQNGIKQQTLWKQEIYRDIIGKINSFQSKYFSSSSSTNLLSKNFFNLMSAATESKNFKVTATSSAAVGTTSFKVNRLASNTKITSGEGVSGVLAGELDQAKLDALVDSNLKADRSVTFKVGSTDVTVDLKDVFVDSSGKYTQMTDTERAEAIQNKLNTAFSGAGLSGVKAEVSNGALKITSTKVNEKGETVSGETVRLSSTSSAAGLSALGLTEGQNGTILLGTVNTRNTFSFDVTLDDAKKPIALDIEKITDASGKVDMALLADELQAKLDKAHGTNQVTVNYAAGKIDFEVGTGRKVLVGGSSDVLSAFGLKNGQSNRIGMGGTIEQNYFKNGLDDVDTYKFTINGVEFAFGKDATMTEVMNGINASGAGVRCTYRSLDDKFTLEAANSGEGFDVVIGDTEGNLMEAMFGTYVHTAGVNAEVEVDGVVTTRNTNSFSINGLNFDLKAVTPAGETETVEVTRGTDQIVEGVKSFINDYNEMIDELNKLIREDTNYKKYDPLTDAQKKEMSEREIELWEEKAKEGLLYGDSALTQFLSSMRSALYEKPAGALYAIYDIGIETSGDWKDFGKLVLSADGETKLRQAIESNPDEVLRLFTDEEEGLAVKMEKILTDTANTSSGSPGSLVQIAGVVNKATEYNNDLYTRIKAIEDKIEALKRTYEKEKTRYWRQFNAMEQVITNMNSQSSWLAMQMSS